jgi:L-glutamine-phosphate cytidylyltransferase
MTTGLPAIYLAAGEGRRLGPLTDRLPKAMIELGGVTLAARALAALREAGVPEIVAVTGHYAEALEPVASLIDEQRPNPRYADAGNIYSLWCARDVVERGCYIVNSDVLFEDEIARRLVRLGGSALLCSASHGVDEESMKAVEEDGRLTALSKSAPIDTNPEYIGLTRIDPADGPALAAILERRVGADLVHDYYEAAIEELANQQSVRVERVDGLAWIEIDDHEDLERARSEVLEQVS